MLKSYLGSLSVAAEIVCVILCTVSGGVIGYHIGKPVQIQSIDLPCCKPICIEPCTCGCVETGSCLCKNCNEHMAEKNKVGAIKGDSFLGRGKLAQSEDPSMISFNTDKIPNCYLTFKMRPDLMKVAQGFIGKTAIASGTITTLGKVSMCDVTGIHQQNHCYCDARFPDLCVCDACECSGCEKVKGAKCPVGEVGSAYLGKGTEILYDHGYWTEPEGNPKRRWVALQSIVRIYGLYETYTGELMYIGDDISPRVNYFELVSFEDAKKSKILKQGSEELLLYDDSGVGGLVKHSPDDKP